MARSETDVELAVRLATGAGALLVELRRRLVGRRRPAVGRDGRGRRRRPALPRRTSSRWPAPTTPCCRRKGWRTRAGGRRTGCGSSTRSTAPASSASRAASTGPCTSPCGTGREFGAGAVALPAVGRTLATDPPPDVPDRERGRPVVVTSRSRTVVRHGRGRPEALDANVVTLGSAGAKAMAVVNGDADVYVHAGGMYQWDSAAPAAVALAAGLHVSRIDGSPIVYNEPDPWLPDFLVCRPRFAEPVLAALDAARR